MKDGKPYERGDTAVSLAVYGRRGYDDGTREADTEEVIPN